MFAAAHCARVVLIATSAFLCSANSALPSPGSSEIQVFNVRFRRLRAQLHRIASDCGSSNLEEPAMNRRTKNLRAVLVPYEAREHGSLPWHRGGGRLGVGGANRGVTLPRLSRIDRKWRSIIRLTSALGGSSAQIAVTRRRGRERVKSTQTGHSRCRKAARLKQHANYPS